MNGVGDRPEIPGTIAQCEWCGFFVSTFTDTKLHFCPNCHHGTLRDDCPHCHAPISYPPQLHCLSCGKSFTVMTLQPMLGGQGAVNIIEPDAKRRAELEAKGNHWHDVVRGKAEGPQLPPLKESAHPPPGWDRQAFDQALREARINAGDDLTEFVDPGSMLKQILNKHFMQVCEKCNLTFVLEQREDAVVACPFCKSPMEPPKETQGG